MSERSSAWSVMTRSPKVASSLDWPLRFTVREIVMLPDSGSLRTTSTEALSESPRISSAALTEEASPKTPQAAARISEVLPTPFDATMNVVPGPSSRSNSP
jgi:hypothetical protein